MSDQQITPGSVPEKIKEMLHQRTALCGELNTLTGDDSEKAVARAAAIAEEYAALEPLPEEYAEIADKDFVQAQKNFQNGLAEAAQAREFMQAAREKLAAAVAGLTELASAEQLLPKRKELEMFCKDLRSVAGCDPTQEALGAKLAEDLSARLQAESDRAAKAEADLKKLLEDMLALQASGDIEAYRKQQKKLEKTRDSAMGSMGKAAASLPESAKLREIFKAMNASLTQHLQTLDLARWESYTLKLDLLRELEEMQTTPDERLAAAGKRLREIRERWKELGAVPHEKQQETGPKFYDFTTALQHRIDAYFKVARAERSSAVEAKTRLCEAAEALAESTDYQATADKLKALQQEWKAAGHAGREQEQKLYARFRAACDKFFQARNAWWESRNAERSAGEKTKRELCEAVAGLSALPRRDGVARAKELRAAFNAAPRAGKAEAELQALFNSRMEAFFQSLQQENDQAMRRRNEILAELAVLGQNPADEDKLRTLTAEWQSMPAMPRELASRMEAKFRSAETAAGKHLQQARQERRKASTPFFPTAMREAVQFCAAAAAGGVLPEITVDLTAFPRLAAAVTDLSASAGEFPEELQKAIKQNTREFKKLLDTWENAVTVQPEKQAALDLAAELTAAIAGNFGGAAVSAATKDKPQDIQRKLLAIGVLDAAEAEALISRYETLAAKL